MSRLPWENGMWDARDLGKTFVDNNGVQWQTYEDPAAPNGTVAVKRTDKNGVSFDWVTAPTDTSEARAGYADTERQNADQNTFNRSISQGGLDVNRQNAGTNAKNAKTNQQQAQTGQYNAKTDRAYKQALVQQAKDDLAFKYAQQAQTYQIQQAGVANDTLKLGASLRGPRDWDQYLETASQAGQNPLLQQALGSWATLTGARPNTGASTAAMPSRFDLNAMVGDFTGQGAAGSAATGYDPMKNRIAALDTVAMNPGQAGGTGWWTGLSSDEQQRAKGYWETRGWSPDSVLNGMAYTGATQGLGYNGA